MPDPPYHWVCDPSCHHFVETFTSLAFTSLSNDLPIMMSPTAIKLVLSYLWYRNASDSTNMFSDCRSLIALKPINLRWIVATKAPQAKPCRVIRLPWQAPATLRLFEGAGQPGRHNWQWRYVIHAQMICYGNDGYLHDAPGVSLWKTVQHRQDYLSRWLIKFRTQYNT